MSQAIERETKEIVEIRQVDNCFTCLHCYEARFDNLGWCNLLCDKNAYAYGKEMLKQHITGYQICDYYERDHNRD